MIEIEPGQLLATGITLFLISLVMASIVSRIVFVIIKDRNEARSELFIAQKDLESAKQRITTLVHAREAQRQGLESDIAYAVQARADLEREVAADSNRLEKLTEILRSALEWLPPELPQDTETEPESAKDLDDGIPF